MENKSNRSGGQSSRNRNQSNRNQNNRNRSNHGGGQRNSNNNKQKNSNNRNSSNRNNNSNSNRSRNNNNNNRNRNRSRSRTPKKVELTPVQKFLKAITFGAIDPNKKLVQQQKQKQASKPHPQAKTKKPAQPMSEKGDTQPKKKKSSRKLHEVTSPRLYVGNLDYGAAEDDLDELFRGVGNVISTEVVTNSRTQQSKGFAFVEMGSMEEAKRAVEVLHDQDFMGRKLLVSGARSDGPRTTEEKESVEAV